MNKIMDIFKKLTDKGKKLQVQKGEWVKCPSCKTLLHTDELNKSLKICSHCGYYFRMTAVERAKSILDEIYTLDLFPNIKPVDILNFKDTKRYKDRIKEAQEKTGLNDAMIISHGKIFDREVVLGAMDFRFMGGSMGSVVGAKFVRGAEYSIAKKIPFIVFTASGGARMQESIISLMQMAKTTFAINDMNEKGILYITVLTDPTMGGVSASFAFLGDIILAEPNSLIGFAGPRVIEQTIRETLPENFQRSEFLLDKGMIDRIVERKNMKKTLYLLIKQLNG